MVRRAMEATDPEEVKRAGKEWNMNGCLEEALKLYDRLTEA